jgi:hypothetical protein
MSDEHTEDAPLAADEVARRLRAVVAASHGLTEADLKLTDGGVQDALAELAFSHGFTRLARQVTAIRRIAARLGGSSRPRHSTP